MQGLSSRAFWGAGVVGLALVILPLGCQSGEIVGGPDLPDSEPAEASGWSAGLARAPMGVGGKPIVETATGPVIGDELLVRFTDGTSLEDQTQAVAAANGVIVYRGARSGYNVVRFASVDATELAAQTLRADGRVRDAIYNHVIEGNGPSTSPGMELGRLQWNFWAMQLDPFHYAGDAEGVVIAVLDTGVAYEDYSDALGDYLRAPDLDAVDFVGGYDFINDDEHPNDDQRHGTHVTGVIATKPGIPHTGVAALAPNATIMPVKVLDNGNSGTELALAEGIEFAADQGAQVINMSLSFPPTYFPSQLMQRAVDHASKAGVVMVAAAGNHAEDLVAYPAAFRDVIAVGASDLPDDYETDEGCGDDDEWDDTLGVLVRAPYSNRGWKLDVLTPGGTIPGDANGDGRPEGILAQTFASGDPTAFDYYFYAGTSQAAAEVSALAAVMLHDNPDLGPHEIRALLIENAKSMGPARGHGELDFDTGL
jgi:serine protease